MSPAEPAWMWQLAMLAHEATGCTNRCCIRPHPSRQRFGTLYQNASESTTYYQGVLMLVEGQTNASRHLWGVLGWGRAPQKPAWSQIDIRNRPYNASYALGSSGCTCGCRSPRCFRSFLSPCVSILDHIITYMRYIHGVDTLYFI